MAEVTLADFRKVLDYSPDVGEFRWKVNHGKARVGAVAGTVTNGYFQIGVKRKLFKGGRLAWLFVHGAWPQGVIDHIDGNPSNNRIANLRDVPHSINSQNMRKAHTDSKTGLLGVEVNHTRFSARIMVRGKQIYIGTFATPEAAHAAYISAKRKLHSGCTI